MVNSLSRSGCQRVIAGFASSLKEHRVTLAIVGLVCLISLPFLRAILTKGWNLRRLPENKQVYQSKSTNPPVLNPSVLNPSVLNPSVLNPPVSNPTALAVVHIRTP